MIEKIFEEKLIWEVLGMYSVFSKKDPMLLAENLESKIR